MKFLILTEDYPAFLHWFTRQHRGLEHKPYADQRWMRVASLFGGPFLYADSLETLGHEAQDLYVNNEAMQKAWAREHGVSWRDDGCWGIRLRRGWVPWLSRRPDPRWRYEILAAQIKHYQPDVLFNQAMDTLSSRFLQELKPYVGMLLGQHAASPLPLGADFSCYDLVLSSFPPTVEHFRTQGIPAAFQRLGFGPACGAGREGDARPWDITFVGNFFPIHRSRLAWLEALCTHFPQIHVWGQPGQLARGSAVRRCYQGPAWGREMFSIFARSKITLNHHGNIRPYANNCRLYEATGMGALLVTDWAANLHEMFEPDTEVVAYRSVEHCVDLLRYYLDHPTSRDKIARAGRERTLREHTYVQRMEELVALVGTYLGPRASPSRVSWARLPSLGATRLCG